MSVVLRSHRFSEKQRQNAGQKIRAQNIRRKIAARSRLVIAAYPFIKINLCFNYYIMMPELCQGNMKKFNNIKRKYEYILNIGKGMAKNPEKP